MSDPLISVVIPCYNQARFVLDALGSVLAQTYSRWECLVVNDGSPDSTGKVVRAAISRYSGHAIRLVETENRGLAEARNNGIRQAKGELILPLDADDLIHADYLTEAVAALRNHPEATVATCLGREFGAGTAELSPPPYHPAALLEDNRLFYASVFPRTLWERAGGYDPSVPWGAEDWNFWITCSGLGMRPVAIPKRLFFYRKHTEKSMYDQMMGHWQVVRAMVRSSHPLRYPPARLAADHQVIAQARPETEERLRGILARFPERPRPHFWMGLIQEVRGDFAGAAEAYEKAVFLAPPGEWQPLFRRALLAGRTEGQAAARPWMERFLKEHSAIRFQS